MQIICSRRAVRKFREECKRLFPVEHVAALFGYRSSDGDIWIDRIESIRHDATEDCVNIDDSAMWQSKRAALKQDKDWLGTIHSHCWTKDVECCWHLSSTDIESAMEYGEAICGLVYVFEEGKKSKVHWYVPSPIPKVAYV